MKVVKNKVAPPFRVAEFDILFTEGISKEGGLLDVGQALGILRKSGSFFSYGDTRLGQGRENSREFLKENPAIAQEIEQQIRNNGPRYQVMELDGVAVGALLLATTVVLAIQVWRHVPVAFEERVPGQDPVAA